MSATSIKLPAALSRTIYHETWAFKVYFHESFIILYTLFFKYRFQKSNDVYNNPELYIRHLEHIVTYITYIYYMPNLNQAPT